ncbi:hypothetical protein ABZW96_36490 [Nocardia sp. NPDC004168]|uniref:hypothetical protein n=1 Tax=Nocardia sp. NPDC004168 TaxID=3154452 RepID=UPI0033B992A1
MIVNHKLVASIMFVRGIFGLLGRKQRGHPILTVSTPTDLLNRTLTAAPPTTNRSFAGVSPSLRFFSCQAFQFLPDPSEGRTQC